MAKIEKFEDIEAWKLARETTREIYLKTSNGEFSRDFPLRDQIRRASISIMSNIAEGFEREGNKEFLNFLSIAKGSCGEVRSQVYIAYDQDYLTREEFEALTLKLETIGRLLGGFMKYLRASDLKGNKFK